MKVVLAWPDWSTKADRCVMFSWVAEWADEVYLITARPLPADIAEYLHPDCKVHYTQTGGGAAFIKAAGKIAHSIARQARDNRDKVVFHEMVVPRLVPQARLGQWLPKSQYRSILSLYTPTPTTYRKRAWRKEPSQLLPLPQEISHFRVTLQRMVSETIGVHLVDCVLGNSQEIIQDVLEAYRKPANQVHLYPGEIDTRYYAPAPPAVSQVPTLLFLGRFYLRKGIYELLEAASILRDRGCSFRLLMMGDNYLEPDQVDTAISTLGLAGSVEILPRQSRPGVRAALQGASVLVLPSYLEGSPRVVKEAMACACPVVVSDIPGVRSIDPEGEALTFVPAGDSQALASALQELLSDHERRITMGRNGRAMAEQKFSAQKIAHEMYMLYTSLFENDTH